MGFTFEINLKTAFNSTPENVLFLCQYIKNKKTFAEAQIIEWENEKERLINISTSKAFPNIYSRKREFQKNISQPVWQFFKTGT